MFDISNFNVSSFDSRRGLPDVGRVPVKRPVIEPQSLAKLCNEALLLACLERGPQHGYQIALDIEERGGGFFRFNHGTLYPILHKLEKDGLIKGSWSDEEGGRGGRGGRKRKSYTLTAKGRRYSDGLRTAWREFIEHFVEAVEVEGGRR
jgi:DNA-binding PadR family transcriptional regulator